MTKNLRFKKLLGVLAIVLATSFVFSQVSYSQNNSSEKVLEYFAFLDASNAALDADYVGVIDQVNRTVTVPDFPFGTVMTNLTSTFAASDKSNVYLGGPTFATAMTYPLGSGLGAASNITAGTNIDFTAGTHDGTDERRIWVEAENHSREYYSLVLGTTVAASDCDLLSFVINGSEYKLIPLTAGGLSTAACDPGTAIAPATATAITTASGIIVEVPFGTDLERLVISGTHNGSTVVYDPGVSNTAASAALGIVAVTLYDQTAGGNFLVFRVTAQDATTQDYTLVLTVAAADKTNLMTTFMFDATNAVNTTAGLLVDVTGVIDQTDQTITVVLPFGMGAGAHVLVPTFDSSPLSRAWNGVETSPPSLAAALEACSNTLPAAGITYTIGGAATDMSIVAQDITDINVYHITVTQGTASTVASLDDIQFDAAVASTCTGPAWDTGVLVPVIAATADNDITYQNEAVMTAVTFTFNVDDAFATISSNLAGNPAITSTTAYDIIGGLTPVSGVYTLILTVTAEDGTTTGVYNFNFTQGAASNAKEMLEIGFYANSPQNVIAGVLVDTYDDAYDVNKKFLVEVPWYVDVHTMTAYFDASPYACVFIAPPGGGAYVAQTSAVETPASADGTPNDHSNSITYVVVAQDLTEERYDLEVYRVPASTEKELSAFSFETLAICSAIVSAPTYDADGVLDGAIYTVTVRYGTVVTALVPTFTNSALSTVTVATVPQTSGVTANDFTAAVTYTVTAEDLTTMVYTINVVEHALATGAAYSDKQITDYQIPVALNPVKDLVELILLLLLIRLLIQFM